MKIGKGRESWKPESTRNFEQRRGVIDEMTDVHHIRLDLAQDLFMHRLKIRKIECIPKPNIRPHVAINSNDRDVFVNVMFDILVLPGLSDLGRCYDERSVAKSCKFVRDAPRIRFGSKIVVREVAVDINCDPHVKFISTCNS